MRYLLRCLLVLLPGMWLGCDVAESPQQQQFSFSGNYSGQWTATNVVDRVQGTEVDCKDATFTIEHTENLLSIGKRQFSCGVRYTRKWDALSLTVRSDELYLAGLNVGVIDENHIRVEIQNGIFGFWNFVVDVAGETIYYRESSLSGTTTSAELIEQ